MQQAIYHNSNSITATRPVAPTTTRTLSVGRHLARKWDLYGVLTLLASCTAYGVFVLGQVA